MFAHIFKGANLLDASSSYGMSFSVVPSFMQRGKASEVGVVGAWSKAYFAYFSFRHQASQSE